MKILAFGASNSKNSINQKLALYTASLVNGAEIETLDLNDYELPIYSQERQDEGGIPALAHQFLTKIAEADALIISFAEHNGSFSVAYKNIYDWASRENMKVFQEKKTLFLSTSPGPNGGATVLEAASKGASFQGANLVDSISVGNFFDIYDDAAGTITDDEVNTKLKEAVVKLAVTPAAEAA
ncbi:NADPH-dependent FMN reductase [Curvivirga aplysinae]|uniref:NADPH-dependent FMN reductase n=1 Tax=Curvivirga aplysinae TaxID=2529852 RepID=UPI0012BB9046|nr:NAD(P)H-dependent oxidoreductase [Curvivirga aplysinae]MTI09682.1 NADPH-dependent oxidoreductase [Curvivirga aplysinae]